ncbi:hypothetical protein V5H37_23430, partial [Salmonella enterica]|uniref:hypothetical protein n=1 Tax=Salmonella enterica TaxID=28901 RepID=UPI002FCD6D5A
IVQAPLRGIQQQRRTGVALVDKYDAPPFSRALHTSGGVRDGSSKRRCVGYNSSGVLALPWSINMMRRRSAGPC